jgi:hypothetical protein
MKPLVELKITTSAYGKRSLRFLFGGGIRWAPHQLQF